MKLSNKKLNLLTKTKLKNALLLIMEQESFKSISISELTKKSGVSRNAFYRNYQSKEAILLDISKDVMEEVSQVLSKEKHNRFAWFKKLFETTKKYYKILKLTIVDACIPLQNMVTNCLPNENNKNVYQQLYFQTALNSIISQWLITNMQESEDEMASLCMEIFE